MRIGFAAVTTGRKKLPRPVGFGAASMAGVIALTNDDVLATTGRKKLPRPVGCFRLLKAVASRLLRDGFAAASTSRKNFPGPVGFGAFPASVVAESTGVIALINDDLERK